MRSRPNRKPAEAPTRIDAVPKTFLKYLRKLPRTSQNPATLAPQPGSRDERGFLCGKAALKDTVDGQSFLPGATAETWLSCLERFGEEAGHFVPLGDDHAALFSDEGRVLLVTFETEDAIRRDQPDGMPMGLGVAQKHGWSSLCLIARGQTWYRDRRVHAYFDRLVDDAFFEDFDRVVLYGAGMAGYAACAYSAAAPGATVIALSPQATLDPRVTGWDRRFRNGRRRAFTDRYGYAPEMIEGAGQVFLVHDPCETFDDMHASLFTRPFVTRLRCPGLGPGIAGPLATMKVLPQILEAACQGRFDAALFWRLYRARRDYRPYLRRLLARLEGDGRTRLGAYVCRNAADRLNAPRFRARQIQLEQQLRAAGQDLPPHPDGN